jgi:cytochrome c oxidase subunit 3
MLLLAIETMMFALLVSMYFYARVVDFDLWPPPQVNAKPIFHPAPDWTLPSINLGILLVSVLPMLWVDRACLKRNVVAVKIGLVSCVILGAIVIGLRFLEFHSLHFQWNENAYASIVWTILGLHLTHLVIATSENLIMTVWVFVKGLDDKHARDVRVTASYWYWVAGIWLVLYLVVWGGGRLL